MLASVGCDTVGKGGCSRCIVGTKSRDAVKLLQCIGQLPTTNDNVSKNVI
jgi:hypothetical protein